MSDSKPAIHPPDLFKQQPSWAARNGFADWALALIWLVLCITVFQFVALFLFGIGYVLVEYFVNYPALMQMLHNLQQGDTSVLTDHLNLLFLANTTWQVLFLGLGTYFFARVCAGKGRRRQYLRLKINGSVWRYVALAIALIVAAQPLILFLGWLNSFIPVPETLKNLQQSQMDLIGDFMKNSGNVLFVLINVALVPALCEETLFRGFVMRSFEKKWGIIVAVIVSGLLFGLYHIQLSNLLPLASIGMLLAILAWSADSILPSMLAHFINNAAAVLLVVYYPNSSITQSSPGAMPPLWLVIISGLVTAYLIYLLVQQPNKNITQREIAYD